MSDFQFLYYSKQFFISTFLLTIIVYCVLGSLKTKLQQYYIHINDLWEMTTVISYVDFSQVILYTFI